MSDIKKIKKFKSGREKYSPPINFSVRMTSVELEFDISSVKRHVGVTPLFHNIYV